MRLLRDKDFRPLVAGNTIVQLVVVKSSGPAVEASLTDFELILQAAETICETETAQGTEMHLCAGISIVLTAVMLACRRLLL